MIQLELGVFAPAGPGRCLRGLCLPTRSQNCGKYLDSGFGNLVEVGVEDWLEIDVEIALEWADVRPYVECNGSYH